MIMNISNWCMNCSQQEDCPLEYRILEVRDIPEATINYCSEYIDDKTGLSHPERDIPTIVCLCGSGRFQKQFEEAEFNETISGKIVRTIGCNTKDISRNTNLSHLKPMLDELNKRKIDLSNEVLILNVNGYIGESTKNELNYAKSQHKRIRYLEPPKVC